MRWSNLVPLARHRIAWTAVLVANLPIPILFSRYITDEGGKVGMALGIACVWFLGHECCRRHPRAIWGVFPGGWLVAASQVFPCLHVIAGFIGLWIALLASPPQGDRFPEVEGILTGFTATILTGGILLTVAAVLGLGIRWLFWPDGPTDKPEVARDELA